MSEWQPIETVMGGDRVLLCLGGLDVCIGTRDPYTSKWSDDGIEPMPFIIQPTHWMPLPEPPDEKAE
jgi:hypothetical protein